MDGKHIVLGRESETNTLTNMIKPHTQRDTDTTNQPPSDICRNEVDG